MCDYQSSYFKTLISYRRRKRYKKEAKPNILRFSPYPLTVKIIEVNSHSVLTVPPSTTTITSISSASSLSPYWCNRAVGLLLTATKSIVCFCPPQYYGTYCQYHTDRVSVLLHLDLSQSPDYWTHDPSILLKLLVLFIYNDEILHRDQFHLHPSSQISNTLTRKKFVSHFLYPRSSFDLQQKRQRFLNRSDLLIRHPYSIRIELYQTLLREDPVLIGVWDYPLYFDHLPVTRLAKVLRLTSSIDQRQNPCSSQPCHPDERCHLLMNDKSNFICLCPTNYTGSNCSVRDPQCDQGYCLAGSLCQPHARSSSPFCLCPPNRYGFRCSIEHVFCLFNPCLNNGSCFPDSQPDQVICLCTKEYAGSRCQWKRPSIYLSLSTHLSYAGAVLQFFDIDSFSLDLIPLHQQAVKTLPQRIEYYHQQDRQQTTITGVVLAKLYSSDEDQPPPNIHLLALYVDVFSVHGTTEISQINQCAHLRTFTNGDLFRCSILPKTTSIFFWLLESSPIRYHQICRNDWDILCFRDDIYLCLCAENHTRVECFLYNDELDHCSRCLAKGRCLKGDLRQPKDFLCLCPSCHSGGQCQFNTKSFSFTLDQLFSSDLLSTQRQRTTISLLAIASLFIFFFALVNNLFSFVTFRRPSSLRYGVGHYLLCMSVINQLSLALLLARLLHLILNITGTSSFSSTTNDLLCKSLNYSLSSSTRLVYWLTSLIAIERVYTTIFLRGQWLKQPRIARRLMAFIFFTVFVTDLYELFFYESFSGGLENHGSLCILQISSRDRSLWMTVHLLFLILHSLIPLLINLVSTITICLIIIRKKINTHPGNHIIDTILP